MNNILLVEDSETLGFALKEYLELRNFNVRWAKDGAKGEAFFEKYPTDLCILDVMMPEQDGFSLAEKMRLHAPDVPLIFLTARALKADKLRAFGLGADDYIVKPVDEEELVARIHAVLRRSKKVEVEAKSIQLGNYVFDVNAEDKDRIVRVYTQVSNFDMDQQYFTINIIQSETGDIVKSTQQYVYSTSKDVVNFNSFMFYMVDDRELCAISLEDLGENQACPDVMTGKYELQIQ
ncbi:MAG: response regulator transcription factor, partial [Chitinophagales bacterium]|nr:response regulator transcription factor [Chitinophagales bacterium]